MPLPISLNTRISYITKIQQKSKKVQCQKSSFFHEIPILIMCCFSSEQNLLESRHCFGTIYDRGTQGMDEIIDAKTFAELAAVGALDLTAGESELLRREMNRQMSVISQLDVVPLNDDLQPVVHGNPYPSEIRCGLREDIPQPFENSAGIIAQAPVTRDGFIVSPDVPHQRIG